MNKAYNRINNGKGWKNFPCDETPLNEQNLNKQDIALDEIDNRVIALDSTKATKTEVSTLFKEVEYNTRTGILKFTRKNGAIVTIDTPMEKIALNIYYDPVTEMLTLPLIDGTQMQVDLSRLITEYEFTDSDTIAFSVSTDGNVTAVVKDGSIHERHMQPNYLADIKVEAAKAEASAVAAGKSQSAAKTSETNAKRSETNAKESENAAAGSASDAADSAASASGSATSAAESAATATQKATAAGTSATNAANSASTATSKANAASASATNAANSAANADTYAKKSQSYAVGGTGTREGEDTDNAFHYYEQVRNISERVSNALIYMGTVTSEQLLAITDAEPGYTYNVSNEFTTTAEFKEGAGRIVPLGSNVCWTADGKWDVLAGSPVTGVKGNKEVSYRKGNVNLTPENIGAVSEPLKLTNQNLNDVKPGVVGMAGRLFYYASGGNTCVNKPPGVNNFGIESIRVGEGVLLQRLYVNQSEWYTRLLSDNTWSAWERNDDAHNNSLYVRKDGTVYNCTVGVNEWVLPRCSSSGELTIENVGTFSPEFKFWELLERIDSIVSELKKAVDLRPIMDYPNEKSIITVGKNKGFAALDSGTGDGLWLCPIGLCFGDKNDQAEGILTHNQNTRLTELAGEGIMLRSWDGTSVTLSYDQYDKGRVTIGNGYIGTAGKETGVNDYYKNILKLNEVAITQLGSLKAGSSGRMAWDNTVKSIQEARPNAILYASGDTSTDWCGFGVCSAEKSFLLRVGTTATDVGVLAFRRHVTDADCAGITIKDYSHGAYFHLQSHPGYVAVLRSLGFEVKNYTSGYVAVKASAFNVQSSLRYKENVMDMPREEARKLLKLPPKSFSYKTDPGHKTQFGLIAEETFGIIPSAVTLDREGHPDAIDYSKFTPHLIKMTQLQQEEIDSLKEKNQKLEDRLARLEELPLSGAGNGKGGALR